MLQIRRFSRFYPVDRRRMGRLALVPVKINAVGDSLVYMQGTAPLVDEGGFAAFPPTPVRPSYIFGGWLALRTFVAAVVLITRLASQSRQQSDNQRKTIGRVTADVSCKPWMVWGCNVVGRSSGSSAKYVRSP